MFPERVSARDGSAAAIRPRPCGRNGCYYLDTPRVRLVAWLHAPDRPGWNTGRCPTISRMTVTLLTSQSAPTATDADALVIGVFQGPDGPAATPGTDEIDVMAALTALGATGKSEEMTKVPTAGRLAAPVIVAVGLGPEPKDTSQDEEERQAYLERLR